MVPPCESEAATMQTSCMFSGMSQHAAEEKIREFAREGARAALKELGIDKCSSKDIATICDLLASFRLFRKEAWKSAITGTARVVGWSLILAAGAVCVQVTIGVKNLLAFLGKIVN